MTNPGGNGLGSQYNYDATGNITTRTIAGTNETYNYDPNHPYAVDTVTSGGSTLYSASYDADGNMTSRNGYPITWTPGNLPASVASASGSSTFSYDPDHARYYQAATFNGVTTDTTYVGSLFEVVSTSSSTEYRYNIIADGEVIAVHTITGTGAASTSYLHYDHLGSVDAITDNSGNLIQAMSFDAFGLRRDATNWDYDLSQNTIATLKNYTDRGYTFQEELDNVGLVHMNGRVYDPTVGRMISADPTVPAPFNSQAFNRFAYVYDSPLEYTDPSGYAGGSPCPVPESTGGSDPPCKLNLQKIFVIGDNTNQPVTNPNSTNTTSTPGNGPSGQQNQGPNAGKNPNKNSNNNPNNNSTPPPKQNPPPPDNLPCRIDGSSIINNPNIGRNIAIGGATAGVGFAVVGGLVVANIVGFPEVPAAEITAGGALVGGAGAGELLMATADMGGLNSVIVGAFSGAGIGGALGAAGGALVTPSKPTCPK